MKPKRPERPPQRMSQEILATLLALVRRKFYAGDDANFFKDRWYLLQWAIWWPARHFFTPKQVELPGERLEEILKKIITEAAMHQADKIRYRPAWLKMVIQRHFAIHGDEYYEEAKAIRTATETTMLLLGKLPVPQASLVKDFTAASRLLDATKPQRKKKVAPAPQEPDLFRL